MQPLQPRQKFENCKCMLNIIMHAGVLFHHSKFIHHYNNQQCIFFSGIRWGCTLDPREMMPTHYHYMQAIHWPTFQRFQLIRQNLVITLIVFFSHKINLHCKKNPSNSGYVVQLIGCLLLGQGSIHLLCEIYSPFYLQS